MNKKIVCPICNGAGTIRDPKKHIERKCAACRGEGTVIVKGDHYIAEIRRKA
jgi:DnaJ-class molecular chaperone